MGKAAYREGPGRNEYETKIPALPFGFTLAAAEQPGFCKATAGKEKYILCNVVNAGNVPSDATPWTMEFYNAYNEFHSLI